ncbi:AAA family ATPase [Arthrobacter globiformis]|uniref:AAA family ATPase n=1 Tax=Arthrobacter globiformis TaxID=1665 RepID=UPI00279179AA|nr:AAA family ATPase [Arthrobacter globiformis]MDQ0617361.1 DNA helicase-2/ATP-dependent DNA helicase PcrA [Arthrobacter globiformis]
MDKKSQVLAYENAVNSRYLKSAESKVEYRVAGGSKSRREVAPLSGRVSVEGEIKGTIEDYYIGPRHMETDGLFVISWAAPAAAMFFERNKRWNNQKIRARRRFSKRVERLTDYADDWVVRPDGDPFKVAQSRPKQAPPSAPPGGSSWLSKARTGKTSNPKPAPAPVIPDLPARAPSVGSDLFSDLSTAADLAPSTTEDLLRATLAAPRTGGLEAVLSTLQPEQYSLVTAEPIGSLIVQGHAGTGKTIIATHRAAWLVDAARGTALQEVLLVGPTEAWEEHISLAVADLHTGDGRVTISSIQRVLMNILELDRAEPATAQAVDSVALPKGAALTIADLVAEYKSTSRRGRSIRAAYDTVLALETNRAPARSREFYAWREALPRTFETARSRPALWPFLAYIKVLVDPPRKNSHIIVDEAQDLSPLEWQVLIHLNAGAWTLVGDMNQRHSPRTFKKWKDLYKDLPSSRWVEHVINSGFRTTKSISDFAASLLPITQRRRGASPLGEGKPPAVISVAERRRTMESLTVEECLRLAITYDEGTVAVITPHLDDVASAARLSGWKPDGRHAFVNAEGRRFHLLAPEEARGLEFDAVVVMEPAAFRASSGTNGRLYTSLTRANLELVVVHDKPLPAALARAAKKLPVIR